MLIFIVGLARIFNESTLNNLMNQLQLNIRKTISKDLLRNELVNSTRVGYS
jgi:hypothetical protein